MVILTSDQHMHATVAVMTQLRADRAQIARFPATGFDDFLVQQIGTGTETLESLNASTLPATVVLTRTPGAMDGAMLATVLRELRFARILLAECSAKGPGNQPRIDRLDAALLFLESPK